MADVPHAWPAGLLEQQKQEIQDTLKRHDMAISNINAFMMNAIADSRQTFWHPSWIEADVHYRQVRTDHTMRALTLARELGAPSISTEPGGPVAPGGSWNEALKLFVETLKPVVEHAEREDVTLLVEPEPGLLLENAEQFEEFMRYFDSPNLGLNFDIGHFFCAGEDPAKCLRRLRHHVRHIHLEDIAASRVHAHLIPGTGAIDFTSVLEAIQDNGYDGWVTIELYPYADDPDQAAKTSAVWAKKWLDGRLSG
jgi:sugar phosphate isomerase/epimerase